MNLNIPPLGTVITLAEDWTFPLHYEHRTTSLYEALKLKPPTSPQGYYLSGAFVEVTLPAGMELTIRRYYIRLGCKDYDSVTFSGAITPKASAKKPAKPKKVRFWAKLPDVNRIVMTP